MNEQIKWLQVQLQSIAKPEVKHWFENYLKGQITYYGVKTPDVTKLVKAWYKECHLGDLSYEQQLEFCKSLLMLEHAEEKFAGIIYMQTFLVGKHDFDSLLDAAQWCFDKGCFFDWSTADWFTVRVLAKVIAKDKAAVELITRWVTAKSLWQRRASIVALRAVVKEAEYLDTIKAVIGTLVHEQQRFIQTGIGWTISDLSKHFPDIADEIVELHFAHLSKEVIDRHTKHLPRHKEYKQRKRLKHGKS